MDMNLFGFLEDHPTVEPLSVLIRFHHGLGDVVQLGVVLKHLRKHRPNWTVDVWCGRGKHTALTGLCRRVYHDRDMNRVPLDQYDRIFEPGFYESRERLPGKPNTKAVDTCERILGIPWEAELGRYKVAYDHVHINKAADYFASIGAKQKKLEYNVVLIHGSGNTSQPRKNLFDWQVEILCEQVIAAGRLPVILDWDDRSTLPDQKRIFCPRVTAPGGTDLWGGFGSGDAATIAAMIQLSEAFVGVDSGPGKIASATDTPSLICWHGHHPMNFHDPAPNTTHLVPEDHYRLEPLSDRVREDPDGPCGYPLLLEYFLSHYDVLTYLGGMYGLVWEAQRWLARMLNCGIPERRIVYVVPGGIGDSVWALHKIMEINKAVNQCNECNGSGCTPRPYLQVGSDPLDTCDYCDGSGFGPIDVVLSGDPKKQIDNRSVPFLRRFRFINSVKVLDIPHLADPHNPTDADGRYRYVADGLKGEHYFLMPNHALERGRTLAEWLPEYTVDWSVMDHFDMSGTERGDIEADRIDGKFVAFYLGPESGNTTEGHNRGPLWTPFQWVELGLRFQDAGYRVVVVGADYDNSYWERHIKPHCRNWIDLIGRFEIGECFAFLRRSACLVSYQCGLAIVLHYLGGNVVSWWRPDGDSIHPTRKVSFNESMRHGWNNPRYAENYLGLVYGRETTDEVFQMIEQKGWVG